MHAELGCETGCIVKDEDVDEFTKELPPEEKLKLPDRLPNTGIRPSVLKQIRCHAKKCGIGKVILFGSRARGTFRRDSDIDLAVSGGCADLFRLSVEEETDTLLTYDVVDLDRTLNEELLDGIRKEGVVLYEKV